MLDQVFQTIRCFPGESDRWSPKRSRSAEEKRDARARVPEVSRKTGRVPEMLESAHRLEAGCRTWRGSVPVRFRFLAASARGQSGSGFHPAGCANHAKNIRSLEDWPRQK